MRPIHLQPESEAKGRLLESAESLFAQRGFETTSVRDITQQAKMNVAAVNYHFGTREGLIDWVVTRYLGPVQDERLTRLEGLERRLGKGGWSVEEILEAYLRPLATANRYSNLSAATATQLLGRILALGSEGLPEALELKGQLLNDRLIRMLSKTLPGIGVDELGWRLHFVAVTLPGLLVGDGKPGGLGLDAVIGRFLRFAAAGMRDGVQSELASASESTPQALFNF